MCVQAPVSLLSPESPLPGGRILHLPHSSEWLRGTLVIFLRDCFLPFCRASAQGCPAAIHSLSHFTPHAVPGCITVLSDFDPESKRPAHSPDSEVSGACNFGAKKRRREVRFSPPPVLTTTAVALCQNLSELVSDYWLIPPSAPKSVEACGASPPSSSAPCGPGAAGGAALGP